MARKYLHLTQLMRNERRAPAALRHIQNRKLLRLVRHAYENVPMYQRKWKEHGVHPRDIGSVEDLPKLPVVDKKDFHSCTPEETVSRTVKDRRRLLPITTSGSSGVTLSFWIERDYDQLRKAQFLRPYLSNGNGLWDRVLWFRTRSVDQRNWFRKIGLMPERQIYSSAGLEDHLQVLLKFKPKILRGYGSVLNLLARKVLEERISLPKIKRVFTDSELLMQPMRQAIEEAFQAPVIDIYGTFETENIAYECSRHEGYHITTDCVIMEFLKDGQPVKAGQEGEIVCTVLDNLTTPFIRYNLHDIGIYRVEPCTCGRSFPLMTKIYGRSHNYIADVDGRIISTTSIVGGLWPLARFMYEFQVVQESADCFTILLIPTPLYDDSAKREIIAALKHEIPSARVRIKTVERIVREQSDKLTQFKCIISRTGK